MKVNRTIYSVAKSAVFSWNWATLTMLSWVIFHVRGFERLQLYVIFSPWTANFTKVTPPKNMYLPPGTQFLLVDPPLNAIGLVLSSNWVGFVVKTWQPWSIISLGSIRFLNVFKTVLLTKAAFIWSQIPKKNIFEHFVNYKIKNIITI